MVLEIFKQAQVISWTDLSAMIYVVPLVIAAFLIVIYGAADDLASHAGAGIRCSECGAGFENEFALRRHLKEARKEELEHRKVA